MPRLLRLLAFWTAVGLLPIAALLDLLAVPSEPLTVLYAIPMLAAALWLPPAATAVLVAGTLLLSLMADMLQATEVQGALFRFVVLSIIGGLSYLLAARVAQVQERESARRELQRQLAVVAHDLRTPLTIVMGYAQLLGRVEVQPGPRLEMARRIETQMRHMVSTVGDLAEAARLDLGAMEMHPRTVDLVALTRQVVEAALATGASRRVELDAPPELTGVWDPDRVERVLTNLIGNAVRYSPEGSEIRVRIWREGGDALVSVTDQGRGMQSDDLQRLFRPFSRLSTEASVPGIGLGLYICHEIVRAHGGRIWASSPGPGLGSTFAFTLPLSAGN